MPTLTAATYHVDMEGLVAVLPQEVIEAEAELLKHHAHVVPVLEPLSQVHTVVEALWVVGLQRVEHLQLQRQPQQSGPRIKTLHLQS